MFNPLIPYENLDFQPEGGRSVEKDRKLCYKGAADLSSSMATTGWSSVDFMGLCSWPANLLWLISFNYP